MSREGAPAPSGTQRQLTVQLTVRTGPERTCNGAENACGRTWPRDVPSGLTEGGAFLRRLSGALGAPTRAGHTVSGGAAETPGQQGSHYHREKPSPRRCQWECGRPAARPSSRGRRRKKGAARAVRGPEAADGHTRHPDRPTAGGCSGGQTRHAGTGLGRRPEREGRGGPAADDCGAGVLASALGRAKDEAERPTARVKPE